MAREKLTKGFIGKMTQDWNGRFPDFGIYRPGWLLRRVGPLVEGIALERKSSNFGYYPTFHLHCLCRQFPTISMTPNARLRTKKTNTEEEISVRRHEEEFGEICERFEQEVALLPLFGALRFSEVSAAYLSRPVGSREGPVIYEDLILIATWTGEIDLAANILEKCKEKIQAWPPAIVERVFQSEEVWTEKMRAIVKDPSRIIDIVEHEIQAHNLQDIPSYNLII